MTEVGGAVAAGFEPVVDELARLAEKGREAGAALAVYLDGIPVVDLWAGESHPGRSWVEGTACAILSATKGVTALCAQILNDRAQLDVDAPVARYWPDFAVAGKEHTLVRHLLSHTAGVLTFPRYWEVIGPAGRQLADWSLMTDRLAAAPPSWPPGTAFQYAPLSFGYLVGELVRRVDGRSLGRFVADELATPLGLDLWIGLPDKVRDRVAVILPADSAEQPRLARRQALADARARELVRDGRELEPDAAPFSGIFLRPDAEESSGYLPALMNDPILRAAELPACNGISTARSLCRMYAALSMDGELAGVRIVSSASIDRFAQAQPLAGTKDGGFGLGYMRFPMQMLASSHELKVRPGRQSFGHSGAGGALGFADRDNRLAFAYVKNRILRLPTPTYNLVRSVYRCLGNRPMTAAGVSLSMPSQDGVL
ncbi:MAG: serine hydrolase domain-containing protein [Pseudonocardiaceae bacterium]